MLFHMMTHKIILASQSSRRKQLLGLLDLDFSVEVRSVPEIYPQSVASQDVAEYIAKLKANAFNNIEDNKLIITADTVVCVDGQVLGKPKNADEAKEMLQMLSNKSHQVITGVCIKTRQQEVSFSETTTVYFKPLSDTEINYYISRYKPYDKAGAYGIQEWIGAIGIIKIVGSYYNVVGLPTEKLSAELSKITY